MVVIKQLAPQDSDTVDSEDGIISSRSRFHSSFGWYYGFYKSPRTSLVPVETSDVYRILGTTMRQRGIECTRYATVKCVEARLRLLAAKTSQAQRIPSLSVEPLLKDKDLKPQVTAVLEWIKKNGLVAEKDIVDGIVRGRAKRYGIERKKKVRLHEGESDSYFRVCREIRANGPIVAGYTLREGDHQKSYKKPEGATLKDEKGNPLKHAVILTGHKHFGEHLYFTFQDSAGPRFGDNGIGSIHAAAVEIVYIPIVKDGCYTWEKDLQFVG